jgi:dethiobiotin synthetase
VRDGAALDGGSAVRPDQLIVVTGTGTEVGKTWVAVEVLADLRRRGRLVAARKPAQSFDPRDAQPTDAERLATATAERPEAVCPLHRRYPAAMAPPMAAEALGRPRFTVRELAREVQGSWPLPPPEVGLVEAAGGVASPQADDGDTAALIDALLPDLVVVVADAALGVLNLVRLSVAPLRSHHFVVHLNRWHPEEDLQRRNRRWLTDREHVTVTTATSDLVDVIEALRP